MKPIWSHTAMMRLHDQSAQIQAEDVMADRLYRIINYGIVSIKCEFSGDPMIGLS